MCGEENKDNEREKIRDQFRIDLHKFLEDKMVEVHLEDVAEALLYEATNASCFWFGCYLHMLGFLTSELHNGLEEKFDNIRKLIKEAREEENAASSV